MGQALVSVEDENGRSKGLRTIDAKRMITIYIVRIQTNLEMFRKNYGKKNEINKSVKLTVPNTEPVVPTHAFKK